MNAVYRGDEKKNLGLFHKAMKIFRIPKTSKPINPYISMGSHPAEFDGFNVFVASRCFQRSPISRSFWPVRFLSHPPGALGVAPPPKKRHTKISPDPNKYDPRLLGLILLLKFLVDVARNPKNFLFFRNLPRDFFFLFFLGGAPGLDPKFC